MSAITEKLEAIRLRTGRGIFFRDGANHQASVASTPVGVRDLDGDFEVLAVADAVSEQVMKLVAKIKASRAPKEPETEDHQDRKVESVVEQASVLDRAGSAPAVGLCENMVTFSSEVVTDGDHGGSQPAGDREGGSGSQKKSPKIVAAEQELNVGKVRVRVSARIRFAELEAARERAGLNDMEGAVFEPAPWAAWRASVHYASLKPRRGVHVRFLLGENRGLAYLATSKGPLAWQVVSWSDADAISEVLIQAFSLLQIHAVRKLGVGRVSAASVQGRAISKNAMSDVAAFMGVELKPVAGPAFDADMVAFGLALGSLAGNADTLNLAEAVQSPPSLLSRVPWGEVALLAVLFVGMYAMLAYYRDDLEQQLAITTHRNASVEWAKPLSDTKLKQQYAAVQRQVSPLQKFVDRRFRFSNALASLAGELPKSAWLVSVTGTDLIWAKNPNKALGERYLLLQIGAPAERRGQVPPEIDSTVRGLVDNAYFGKTLERIKLADVIWQQRGGEGHSLFSILALPEN